MYGKLWRLVRKLFGSFAARLREVKKDPGSRSGIFGGFFYSWMTVAARCNHDSPRRRNRDSDEQQVLKAPQARAARE
jgi:hypothetical protein